MLIRVIFNNKKIKIGIYKRKKPLYNNDNKCIGKIKTHFNLTRDQDFMWRKEDGYAAAQRKNWKTAVRS